MINSCGCKGTRFCLICKQENIENDLNSNRITYFFCKECGDKAFKKNSSHSQHLLESLDDKNYVEIKGIFLLNNAIDLETERFLVNQIDQNEWIDSQSGRRKQDFGPKVNFKKQKIKLGNFNGLPAYSMNVLEQLLNKNIKIKEILKDFITVEVCNLEYTKFRGSAILPHLDDIWLWGERIIILNLISDTKLILTPNLSNKLNSIEIVIELKKRSFLILFDEARYKWLHEIQREHIQERRIGINFRELSTDFLPNGKYFNEKIEKLLEISRKRI